MSLVVGELTAYLSVDNDDYKRGIRDAKGDLDSLARDAERQANAIDTRSGRIVTTVARSMDQVSRDADRKGQDAGGKLAQGMRMGFVRNSPLIVAAVTGALAAGAPAMIAGATTLFSGIGIAAQAQSVKVRTEWADAWNDIKAEAFDSSTSIQPVLTGLADQVSSSFRQMAPDLREGFEAAAPQLQVFANGVLGLAQNALPGLVRAVQNGMPVTQGLASLLESIGTGLSDFFDAMSAHAPAAGKAFAALGDIVGELLPILGELLGQGAELASIILPPLAAALGVVADVAKALGPLLPAISAGFLGMKVASSVADGVGNLGTKLANLKGSITPANAALGVMGTVIGLTVAAMQESEQQTAEWASALEEGGAAARQAADEMAQHQAAVEQMSSGLIGFGQTLMGTAGFLQIYADDADAAKEAADRWYNSLTPQARAAQDVKVATADLADAIDRYGDNSPQAADASDALTAAQQRQERANAELELAIDGVTSAMIEQADQALAAIDSSFAYRHAVDQLEDAQTALNDAITEHGAASEEAQRAQLDLEEQTLRTAQAYGQQQADLSGLSEDSAGYARIVQTEMLAKLYELRDAAGPAMAASIQQQIDALERSGVSMGEVGRYADTATSRLQNLGAQRPSPVAYLNSVPFFSTAAGVAGRMSAINSLRASPIAWLFANTWNAEGQLNWAARNRTSYVTQYVRQVLSTIPLFHADGGAIGLAGGGVVGPGGPRDDLIPAIGPNGQPFRLSNGEHVLDARDVTLLGGQAGVYALRAALNEGRSVTVNPVGMADGGSLSDVMSGRSGGSTGAVYNIAVYGVDYSSRQDRRRIATEIRNDIIEIERAGR